MAKRAALALSVSEDGFNEKRVGAAFHQAERLLAIGIDQLDVGDASRAGSLASREIEAERLVGPIDPATSTGGPGFAATNSSRTRQASRAASTFSSVTMGSRS